MQGGLGGVDLGEDIFTGDIFVHHFVDGVDLSDNFSESSVQIGRIHALFHRMILYRFPGDMTGDLQVTSRDAFRAVSDFLYRA